MEDEAQILDFGALCACEVVAIPVQLIDQRAQFAQFSQLVYGPQGGHAAGGADVVIVIVHFSRGVRLEARNAFKNEKSTRSYI